MTSRRKRDAIGPKWHNISPQAYNSKRERGIEGRELEKERERETDRERQRERERERFTYAFIYIVICTHIHTRRHG